MSVERDAFKGGTAVITGAGSGIGEALARRTAALGMQVVLADIDPARIDAVAAAIREEGGRALAVPADVRDPRGMAELADRTFEAFGGVRLLVNNAGIEALGFSWELPLDTWHQCLDVNIKGVIHGVRAFVPRMAEAGERAFVANTSSLGGLAIMPVQTAYIMSKHAVLAFSECLRLEMAVKQLPISVSAIVPGPVATRIFDDAPSAQDPVSEFHRGVMQSMIDANGVTPEEAAARILPQIAAGEFWVSTHPEMTREYAAARAEHLAGLTAPTLSDELAATLA